jgi:hypothetical protein
MSATVWHFTATEDRNANLPLQSTIYHGLYAIAIKTETYNLSAISLCSGIPRALQCQSTPSAEGPTYAQRRVRRVNLGKRKCLALYSRPKWIHMFTHILTTLYIVRSDMLILHSQEIQPHSSYKYILQKFMVISCSPVYLSFRFLHHFLQTWPCMIVWQRRAV